MSPPTPPPSSGDVVVTARRDTFRRDMGNVRTITTKHDAQIARFETSVCPLVVGLGERYDRELEDQLRYLIRRVALHVGKERCYPNLTVIVSDQGAAFIKAMRQRLPLLFATMRQPERDALDRNDGPVWNWYVFEQQSRDGRPILGGVNGNANLSLITMPTRMELAQAFVVLDSKAIDGLTVAQIGDFAGMLGLSAIQYARTPQLDHDSILHLLDGSTRLPGATAFDIAYLKSLYRGDPGASYDQRSASMAAAIQRDVNQPAAKR